MNKLTHVRLLRDCDYILSRIQSDFDLTYDSGAFMISELYENGKFSGFADDPSFCDMIHKCARALMDNFDENGNRILSR